MNIVEKSTQEEKISLYTKQVEVLLSDIQKLERQKLQSTVDGQKIVQNAIKEVNLAKIEVQNVRKQAEIIEKNIEKENEKLRIMEEKLVEKTQKTLENVEKRENLAESNLKEGSDKIIEGNKLIQEGNSKIAKAKLLQSRAENYHEKYLELCTTKTQELKEREKNVASREKENSAKGKLLLLEKSQLELKGQTLNERENILRNEESRIRGLVKKYDTR